MTILPSDIPYLYGVIFIIRKVYAIADLSFHPNDFTEVVDVDLTNPDNLKALKEWGFWFMWIGAFWAIWGLFTPEWFWFSILVIIGSGHFMGKVLTKLSPNWLYGLVSCCHACMAFLMLCDHFFNH
jgi:vacuolar-type H+-ATPase subunit I/STV1